jgi:uncharacterized metal-binding protein
MDESKTLNKEEIKQLYDDKDYELMRLASGAMQPGENRVEEIRAFARQAGIKRIGIANCLAVQKEADLLKKLLADEFEVYSMNCKIGKIPLSEFLGDNVKGISCNPAGQAEYLAQNRTELNISLGLCMGHDMIFSAKSSAPVTTLVVKDRKYKHNPYRLFEEQSLL